MCANRSGGKRKEQGIKEELGSGLAFCANRKIARFKGLREEMQSRGEFRDVH